MHTIPRSIRTGAMALARNSSQTLTLQQFGNHSYRLNNKLIGPVQKAENSPSYGNWPGCAGSF